MREQLIQGIVCILDAKGSIAGTGFVVSEAGLIATCSHVIQREEQQESGIPRPEKVRIIFQATGDEQDARLEPDWWLPWNGGDLAIVRAAGTLPPGVQPLLLGSSEGTSGHDVGTFGYPYVGDIEGIGADGRVVRVLTRAGRSLLQLRSNEITVGFSGAPVWDKLRRRVIGMVSAITEPDRHQRLVETAFAVSTDTLRDVCPVLQLSEVCPYRGLAAFTEADTEFFFGRQQTVEGLLNRLRRDPRFLMVLGPSGSGKSSVMQAGLIPQLRRGKVPGSDRWGIIVARPAAHPFDELTKQGLADESHDLTESIRVWLSQHTEQERLMLVIDQFEELLAMRPEALRQEFITQLAKLLHSSFPVTVVPVMRDDFYSRLTQQEALVGWLERSQGPLHVPKLLKQDELIAIVQKPAESVGLRSEEGLVETIVKDAMETAVEPEASGQAGRSAVLPLLEFALTELWRRRQEGMLTHEAYRDIGGVAGALTQWADQAFYALRNGERPLAQRIFTDLVYVGDESQGVLDGRRRRTLTSLSRNEGEQEAVQAVILHLVENRLLATDRDLQSNEETVEIIHDVLLREWGQLKQWLEEDRRFLTWHQELERLVHGWAIQRDKNKLLRGRDLKEAEGWLKERGADLSQQEVEFLRVSAVQRMWNVVRVGIVFILLIVSMGVAGWFYFQPSPDPTHVTNLQDNGVGSLRWAIANAHPGSTIIFDTSLHGTIPLTSGDLNIGKNLTIRSPGPGKLSISSGKSTHIVRVVPGASVTISGFTFRDSKTSQSIIFNQGTLTLNDSTVSGNTSSQGWGGGIYNATNSTLTLNNSIVSGNTAQYGGGGIVNLGTLTLNDSTVSGNTVYLRLNDSTVSCLCGGGIFSQDGTLTLNDSTVSGNTLTLNDSTVSGNTVYLFGGGIFSQDGTLALANSSVSGNTLALNDGTVSGNTVYLFGGGIAIAQGSSQPRLVSVMILYCTVYRNTAEEGGGIWVENLLQQSHVSMGASIVAGNSAHIGPDIAGRLTTLGYNLVGDRSGATFLNPFNKLSTDVLSASSTALKIDPMLRDNGGPTKTLALLPGSPAIDAIPLSYCQVPGNLNSQSRMYTDQRGTKRPDDNENTCDIGAYESSP